MSSTMSVTLTALSALLHVANWMGLSFWIKAIPVHVLVILTTMKYIKKLFLHVLWIKNAFIFFLNKNTWQEKKTKSILKAFAFISTSTRQETTLYCNSCIFFKYITGVMILTLNGSILHKGSMHITLFDSWSIYKHRKSGRPLCADSASLCRLYL